MSNSTLDDLFERAVMMHRDGDAAGAIPIYRELLALKTDFARGHNALGLALMETGDLADAEQAFLRCIETAPEAFPGHFNLGNLLCDQQRYAESADCYRQCLALRDDPDAHFNLANVLHAAGDYAEAETHYRHALAADPDAVATLSNLGRTLYAQERYQEAEACYRRVLERDPNIAQEHFNLAQTLTQLANVEGAVAAYREAIRLDETEGTSYLCLGRLLLSTRRHSEAADIFEQWLIVSPEQPVARHLLAACSGKGAQPRASDDYLREEFDLFANDFDTTVARIDYRGPELLARALQDTLPGASGDLDVLDGGCGTGLCAELLRPYARRLTGVDLSSGMLDKARARALYEDLHEAELGEFLRREPASFDLIACVDTLCYFGSLAEILAAAGGALRPQGVLFFTVEHLEPSDEAPYRLRPSGRYAHRQEHIEHTLAEAGLALASLTHERLRREGMENVLGLAVTARKS